MGLSSLASRLLWAEPHTRRERTALPGPEVPKLVQMLSICPSALPPCGWPLGTACILLCELGPSKARLCLCHLAKFHTLSLEGAVAEPGGVSQSGSAEETGLSPPWGWPGWASVAFAVVACSVVPSLFVKAHLAVWRPARAGRWEQKPGHGGSTGTRGWPHSAVVGREAHPTWT